MSASTRTSPTLSQRHHRRHHRQALDKALPPSRRPSPRKLVRQRRDAPLPPRTPLAELPCPYTARLLSAAASGGDEGTDELPTPKPSAAPSRPAAPSYTAAAAAAAEAGRPAPDPQETQDPAAAGASAVRLSLISRYNGPGFSPATAAGVPGTAASAVAAQGRTGESAGYRAYDAAAPSQAQAQALVSAIGAGTVVVLLGAGLDTVCPGGGSNDGRRHSTVNAALATEALDSLAARRAESKRAGEREVVLPLGLRVLVPGSGVESGAALMPSTATPTASATAAPTTPPPTAHKIPRKALPPQTLQIGIPSTSAATTTTKADTAKDLSLLPPPPQRHRLVTSPDECPLTHRPLTEAARALYRHDNTSAAAKKAKEEERERERQAQEHVSGATCIPYVRAPVPVLPYLPYRPSVGADMGLAEVLFPPMMVRGGAGGAGGENEDGSATSSRPSNASASDLSSLVYAHSTRQASDISLPEEASRARAGTDTLVGTATTDSSTPRARPHTSTGNPAMSRPLPNTPHPQPNTFRPLPALPSPPPPQLSRWKRTKGVTKRWTGRLGDHEVVFPAARGEE